MKSNPIDGRKKSKVKAEVIPHNGLYLDGFNRRVEKATTLDELNKQEGNMNSEMTSVMTPEVKPKKEDSQFGIFDKYANRVDLLFMTKILLKIIVFKKIVKFIALVSLLFFLPTINDHSEDDKKDSRNLNVYGKANQKFQRNLSIE